MTPYNPAWAVKKGLKATEKGAEAISKIRLPRTAKELDESMQELLQGIPVADILVCMAGFYAGYKGVTPMVMLLKGFAGAGQGIGEFFGEMGDQLKKFIDWCNPGPDSTYEERKSKTTEDLKWAFACVGLIEAYMITRPGAFGSVLTFAGDIAKATAEGIGGLTKLASGAGGLATVA